MSVPRLDLSPKLGRPFSLRNAYDYVRLLYWVFFFPQALKWYTRTFIVDKPGWNVESLSKRLSNLRHHPVGHLQVQGLIEATVVPLAIYMILLAIAIPVNSIGILFNVALGCLIIIGTNDEDDVAENLATGMTISILGATAIGIAYGLANDVAIGIALGMVAGLVTNVNNNVSSGVRTSILSDWAAIVAFAMLVYAGIRIIHLVAMLTMIDTPLISMVAELIITVAITFVVGVAAGVSAPFMLVRAETWALCLLSRRRLTKEMAVRCKVTLLPLPGLHHCVRDWLIEDWENGLYNIDQLLRYSAQFLPVIGTVNDALMALPEESLLPAMERIFEHPYGRSLLRFVAVPFGNVLVAELVEDLFFVPNMWRKRLLSYWDTSPRRDTPVKAIAAGLWYLRQGKPKESAQAFESVQNLPHYDEVVHLARALAWANSAETDRDVVDLAEQKEFITAGEDLPPVDVRLRPDAWRALAYLQRTVLEVRTAWQSISRAARLRALNRALEHLSMLQEFTKATLPMKDDLISDLGDSWQRWLQRVKEAGFSVKREDGKSLPMVVMNPYQVGDPVVGQGFVGREDVLRRLEELWAGTSAPTSVVLFGHRRMGKTSILSNLAGHLGASVYLAYINLLLLGDAPGGVSEVLLALVDGIARELRRVGRVAPEVDPAEFPPHPYRAFEHYLRSVREVLGEDRLIIAVDEFEQLDEWMKSGRVPQDFLKVLRGYIQLDPHIAFAFAGLHVLEEMNADYFGPFFTTVTPVRVRFLNQVAVNKALERPTEDFPLRYEPEALEKVWDLTAGQPYLVELIGYRLVNRFNDQAVDSATKPEPCFRVTDIETVVTDPEFYQIGRYYFTGIWGQAGQGEPGQREILHALAPHTDGLMLEELETETGLDSRVLNTALEVLGRHDVVVRENNRWRCAVELMRRWVAQEYATNVGESHHSGSIR